MEYIKKEDLIIGEIYKSTTGSHIFKYVDKNGSDNFYCNNRSNFGKEKATVGKGLDNIINATPEEKHWLEECIKLDKFITFEEAMKSFIPEYVECIKLDNSLKLTQIYKVRTSKKWSAPDNTGCDIVIYMEPNANTGPFYLSYFKLSTKEAYDAQFVVKEPEFVLPEKWYIQRNSENFVILNEWENHKRDSYVAFSQDNNCSMFSDKNYTFTKSHSILGYTEITFEQFKKYVLKEETVIEEKVIESLPQFKVIETIETITKVENNEGNQFFIGDIIKRSSGFRYNITSFKYNENKTEILAIFNNNNSLFANINDIEHYIKPKIQVEPEFILPEKWGIKRNNENDKIVTDYINKIASIQHSYLPNNFGNPYLHNNTSGCCSDNSIREDYTEITFDQFKKYVLKEEVKEETLLEKAKRLYPIGTKFKAARGGDIRFDYKVTIDSEFKENTDGAICIESQGNGTVYFKGEWAKIIE